MIRVFVVVFFVGLWCVSLAYAQPIPAWESISDGLGVEAMPNTNAVVRTTSGVVLFGTEQGLYERTASGWSRASQRPLNEASIAALQLDASGRIWARMSSHGLWASTDNGQTWQRDQPQEFYVMGVGLGASDHLVAFGRMVESNASALFAWSEEGWQAMPAIPGPSFMSIQSVSAVPDGRLVASTTMGLFALNPEGTGWTPMSGFPGPPYPVHPIAVLENGVWLAGTLSYTSIQTRLYRSEDAGSTWQVVANLSVRTVLPLPDGSAFVALDGTSGRGLRRYVDGMLQDVSVQTAGGVVPAVYDISLGDPDASNPADRLHWLGGHGPLSGAFLTGTALSSPDLTAWTEEVGGATTMPEIYALTEGTDGAVYAGHALGLSRLAPGANEWVSIDPPSTALARYVEATADGLWVVSTSGVYFTSEPGATWETRYTPPSSHAPRLAARLTDGSLLVAESVLANNVARTHLVRSQDGVTWEPIRFISSFPHVLAALPDNGAFLHTRIYYGSEMVVGRWRTLDIEEPWSFLGDAWAPLSLESGPAGLLATVNNEAIRSTDLGTSWEPLGMAGRVTAYSETDWLHVGHNGAPVRRSHDGGATWTDIAEGYIGGSLAAHVALQDGRAVLGNTLGVLRSVEALVSSEAGPDESAQTLTLDAFPNPAASTVRFLFALKSGSDASLAVYDMLGRRVALLWEGELSAGSHEQAWNGRGHAAGVYFVRLVTPEGQRTQRVTLLP